MTTEGAQPSPGLSQVIARAVADPSFRQQLVDNPESAVRSAGLQLSSDELQALQGSSREQREQMLQQLQERSAPFHFWWSGRICFWPSWIG